MNADRESKPLSPSDSSPPLAGERVAFTGTLASMTHAQAHALVEQNGGTATHHVSKQTTMLVVGEEGWPLEDDGQPSVKLQQVTQWRAQGLDIKIVSESEWLRLLGLGEGDHEVRRLYTPAMLSQMLGVPVGLIRRWERLGLIRPVRKTYRLPYFDFREVASVRRLSELLEAGVSAERLERSLSQVRAFLPDPDRPLAQLKLLAHGQRVLVRDEAGLVDARTGQRLFDFAAASVGIGGEPVDEEESSGEMAGAATVALGTRPPRAAGSCPPHQLNWTFTDWYDQGCRLLDEGNAEEAIEAFRLCLMERPASPEVHFQLAEALYRTGNTLGALERYHVAVEFDPEYIEAWTQLGCLHAELGQSEAALDAFDIALDTEPNYPDALYHKAQLLDQLGQKDEAATCWRRYLQFDDRGPWAETARQRLAEQGEFASRNE
ncbi:MAG: tetratricopeptide repeat protein [Planctomycetes bacterium]|nr:tetratricopeptide repeat protein [Planctomycetota bacterium]